jgi:hypothetical protein
VMFIRWDGGPRSSFSLCKTLNREKCLLQGLRSEVKVGCLFHNLWPGLTLMSDYCQYFFVWTMDRRMGQILVNLFDRAFDHR